MKNRIRQTQFSPPDNGDLRAKSQEDLQSTFIRNVSHELRTPLTLVQGYAELLHNGSLGALTSEQQKALFIILDRAHELGTLVERIGTLMAIKEHRGDSVPLALTHIVMGVVEGRRAAATQAGLTLEAHLEPDLPLVSGNPYYLRQAIECLLENALKFTPSGGQVKIQVYAEPSWVCVAMTDTGIGMAAEDLERIFSRFYQVDGSTTRQYNGIGLGLTLAKTVIEEYGGRIEVESQPGQGSRFTVRLPALSPTAQVGQPAEGSVILRRILIVDDEEGVALTLRNMLKRLPNCEIAIAASGEQALQLFEQKPFDLLITDYKMPGMDGLTLATRIQRLYPQTAIVMITAYGNDELREQAARASIRGILNKPVGLADIRKAALEALSKL